MRLDHPIFHGPLEPALELSRIDTPRNYRDYPAGAELGDTLEAWRVQTEAFPALMPGLVVDPFGFEDSPDAEWISGGVNSKGPTSLALGRQANLFLWGFFADPTRLTESGRRVLLNSICYIARFAGDLPLVTRRAPARERVFLYMHYVLEREGNPRTQEIVEQLFPAELLERTRYDVEAMTAYYRERLEFVRRVEGRFVVDEELAGLGLSNREPAFLEALDERLAADPQDALAARLLERYIDPAIAPRASEFAGWLAAQRGELFFSDVGGFRWFSPAVPDQPATSVALEHVEASLDARLKLLQPGGVTELVLTLELAGGWHTYTPGSRGGFPLAVEFTWPAGLSPAGALEAPSGVLVVDPVLGSMRELTGSVELRQPVRVADTASAGDYIVGARLDVTVCDALRCLPPQQVELEARVRVVTP